METITPRTLGKVIATHPQSSVQDALLLLALMLAALLLALQYDLFFFIKELSEAERKISLAEGVFLSLLLTASILVFIVRRLSEQKRDVALKVAAEIELRELTALALQDPLTGLLNRRAFLEALTEAVKSPPANGTQHAVFLVDLDHFKRINDSHGHAAGDQVLEVVADRFRAAARPSDIVARIGGDEFAILAYNVDRETARTIGERFLASVTSRIRAGEHSHKVDMSIGVALIPDDGATAEEILRNADLAMYRAKDLPDALMFFEPDMAERRQIA